MMLPPPPPPLRVDAPAQRAPPVVTAERFAPRVPQPPPLVVEDDDADANGVRSLQWIKRRICDSPPSAIWCDFADIEPLHALRPTPRQLANIRQQLAALDTRCAPSDCVFADRRVRISIFGTAYTLSALIHLLCAKTYNARDRIGTLCPCPPQSFVAGRLVAQSVASIVGDGAPPTRELCCVNPRHFLVQRESATQKRKRAEQQQEALTFVVTDDILAEHICPLLGGAVPCKWRRRAERRTMACRRPREAYSQVPADLYQHEQRTMFTAPAGVRDAEPIPPHVDDRPSE